MPAFEDEGLIARFLTEVTAIGIYGRSDNAALIDALDRLPPLRRVLMVEEIIAGTAEKSFRACADLLARAANAWSPTPAANLTNAAGRFVEMLPGKVVSSRSFSWEREAEVTPDFVADLLAGLSAIDVRLIERAVRHLLAWPKSYGLDAILVPALRKVWTNGTVKDPSALELLRAVCLDHLRARIAEPLEQPADWRRPSILPCTCPRCAELARFLDDPARAEWTYKAAQADRSHMEETVKRARADVDTRTERRGSPHALVCTKNQSSYERRVKQRAQDCEDERIIGGEAVVQG